MKYLIAPMIYGFSDHKNNKISRTIRIVRQAGGKDKHIHTRNKQGHKKRTLRPK